MNMPPKNRITLTDAQKYEVCLYACDNKKTQNEYIQWIEQKWGVIVNESTIMWILQTKKMWLATEVENSKAKHHKSVTVSELDLALKEFVLVYQHWTILSNALLVEKAKLLAEELGVSAGTLTFSHGWLQKFKKRNGIRQEKLDKEEASADHNVIAECLLLLQDKCSRYSPDRIYNMDETGLFYRLEPDRTLATKRLAGRKKDKERLCVRTPTVLIN